MELRRSRSMTMFGSLQFEEVTSRYASKLTKFKQEIEHLILSSEQGVDLSKVKDITFSVEQLMIQYDNVACEYESYLKTQRSDHSANELSSHQLVSTSLRAKVAAFKEHLNSLLPRAKSRISHESIKSGHTGSSSHLTRVLLEHTAQVEKAKTRMKFAAEEAEIIKQEAALKASKALLTVKRELEEAESGLSAIRKTLDFSGYMGSEHNGSVCNGLNTNFHTRRYVDENLNYTEPPLVMHHEMPHTPDDLDNHEPQHIFPSNPPRHCNETSELAKQIAKHQLLPKRLCNFNDDPARYLTWKHSFMNIISAIDASTLEHLDLLINHLGPQSRCQAENIRASNPRDPERAMEEIWSRLDCEYGSAETLELTIKQRVNSFPNLTDSDRKRYFDLSDLAAEIESIKCDPELGPVFTYYDTSSGINQFVRKLPKYLRDKWANKCYEYKTKHNVHQVPFTFFCKFLSDLARLRNDPSLVFDNSFSNVSYGSTQPSVTTRSNSRAVNVQAKKTEVAANSDQGSTTVCPIHGINSNHALKDCIKFSNQSLKERKDYLFKNGYCLRCCGQKRHHRKNCKEVLQCAICSSTDHPSILHPESGSGRNQEGEQHRVNSLCTKVCNTKYKTSKSCAKIVLVNVYPLDEPSCVRKVYCMIDDQSNKSLATSSFFDSFGECGPETEYVLNSCAGKCVTSGRKASGYVVQSLDRSCDLTLPNLIECNDIPNNRDEIPSPAVAHNYAHLRDIETHIPDIDTVAKIELLIGRDLIAAHYVLDQRVGQAGQPYGQKLPLGWVIIGDVCLGRAHHPDVVSVYKTSVLADGRPTCFLPCESKVSVKDDPIFRRMQGDEKPGLSIEDQKFLNIMEYGFKKTPEGHWQAPLPFRDCRPVLPDNKPLALRRAKSFEINLQSNPVKRDQVVDFMEKLFNNHHAELAPDLPISMERWYLPIFAVYSPHKPNNARVVFDSSAKFHDLSLNSVLLQGPDLCNNLLGVLLRFRREKVAVTMDVEQMFYNFKVPEEHRRYLRFLWHRDNDLNQPLVEFQMTVHVFGNSPSPAVATYGLRKAVEQADENVKDLINNGFYVDDGLLSCATEDEAVDLVHRAKQALHDGGKIRLHKFASNSRKVLSSFCKSDLAKHLTDLNLGTAVLPMQRSLGLLWNTEFDKFTFKVDIAEKAYTRRGLLSIINSIYDPIGFAQPVVIRGKLLLREMMSMTSNTDWDDPLPESLREKWSSWVESLHYLECMLIPRMYSNISFKEATKREVLVFSDASKDIIAAVAYLKLYSVSSSTVTFLLGKAKVAPSHGHTIPRLELCAAVLATEIAETVRDQLSIDQSDFRFFSDSRVVLGYISNEIKRFRIYVGNRVGRIRLFSKPTQWSFVQSECNPADVATRFVDASMLQFTSWILGPKVIPDVSLDSFSHSLIDPEHDSEVHPDVTCNKVESSNIKVTARSVELFSERFSRFSEWNRLVHAVACLKFLAIRYRETKVKQPNHPDDPEFLQNCECVIIALVQRDVFHIEIQCIENCKEIPHTSSICSLCPVLGADRVLRVGGRLNKVQDDVVDSKMRNPVILPKKHHVTYLIISHYHRKVFHQGRHFTEGAVRAAGFWVVNSKKMVASVIKNCVVCRKLRGRLVWQQMADLPEDRCKPGPPFSYVGVDTCGPWPVVFRRTRGGSANQKRWALLFTCLVSRAIHIEVIEELTSSSFINALRRMMAIRGPVILFRSDRGTNFVGATDSLSINAEFVENGPVAKFLSDSRISWKFNPPHAPHMGGAWERLIGVAKGILNFMLLNCKVKDLTHEVLTTFMAEVCAIVNNRPLIDVSSDPESPELLTPSMIVTMKAVRDTNPFPPFSSKDMLKSTWKYVQVLADEFWRKWRSEYLHCLQRRKKWQNLNVNIKPGDLVLVRDSDTARNEWPTGIIQKTFPSQDGNIRKVEVAIFRDNKRVVYVRPVTELVTILEAD